MLNRNEFNKKKKKKRQINILNNVSIGITLK